MTSISLTSGELLDIINTLNDKAENLEENANFHLANYYHNIIDQLDRVYDKLQDKVPEQRVAELVLAF